MEVALLRLMPLALVLATAGGCIFVDHDDHHDDDVFEVTNAVPQVIDGYAGCDYDRALQSDIVVFDAIVDDLDGLRDVTQVWADVSNERTGELIESFELFPTDDASYWYSDWLAGTTLVDCWYPDQSVDLVVYDRAESYDVLTVWLDTYR